MFVFDQTRSRVAALILAFVTAAPTFPQAHADPRPLASMTQVESKTPKKTKKKTVHDQGRPWAVAARMRWTDRPDPVDPPVDPLKVVIATARKQIGKPYRWGATGPASFDCSGFTSYVWKAAGVTIPRTSSQQYAGLKRVPLKNMRKGDLVFSSGHVGLYLGKGKMIHSPHSGRTVEVAPLHPGTYGAARPSY